MALQRAHIEPSLLVWARETRGFAIDEAAQVIGVKAARLQQWESGEAKPTVRQLRKAADAYRRSIGLFFLPEPPEEDEVEGIRDFRRLALHDPLEMSPALRLEIRLARERRLEAMELADELGDKIPSFVLRADRQDDPDQVGVAIREALVVTPQQQFAWSDVYDAFYSWTAAIERLGVLVFQTGGKPAFKVSTDELRGFSLSEMPLPVIAVNSSDAISARCFTLMHELAHLLLRSGGLCDLHDAGVEAFCNKVAASVLVPSKVLVGALEREGFRFMDAWPDYAISRLANRFKVSRESMLIRLVAINRASQRFVDKWRREQRPSTEPSGRLLPWTRAVMRNGRLLPRLAFDAHSRGHLTLRDLSVLLGENVQHIDKIADKVFDSRYLR